MFFSTTSPRNAADIPRKKIASENAHSVADLLAPIYSEISFEKVDQQYTVPILQ